jgi:hypothetical protein
VRRESILKKVVRNRKPKPLPNVIPAIPPERRPAHGQRWGRWRLDTSNFVIHVLNDEGVYPIYEIDLDRVNTPAQLLDWIFQVAGKGWISATDIGNLVHAIEDIFDGVQGKLCPWGQPRRLNAKQFLRANYPQGEDLYPPC